MSLPRDPTRLIRGLRNLSAKADRKLGRDTLDGRKVVGYEISGEKVGFGPPWTDQAKENRAELWVDAKSGTAVRLVFVYVKLITATREMPLTTLIEQTTVYDQFEWDASLPADWFEPVIPSGYTRRKDEAPQQVKAPDEAALIAGLRLFADLADRYPASLNVMDLAQEVAVLASSIRAKQLVAERKGRKGRDIPSMDSLSKTRGLAFYAFLKMKGREPEYFGATVTADDADEVLLRWRLDDGSFRVIYGDLRVKTVPAG